MKITIEKTNTGSILKTEGFEIRDILAHEIKKVETDTIVLKIEMVVSDMTTTDEATKIQDVAYGKTFEEIYKNL